MDEIKSPYGTSILVPSVQELAQQKILTVPQRYVVLPQQHEDLVISQADLALEIPVIDFQKLLSTEDGNSELSKFHLACKDWGFFQCYNIAGESYGVSPSLIEKVKLETKEFFKLPMSEKKKFWQTCQHLEGFGQAYVLNEDQKLDWADIYFMTILPTHMRLPHLFPNLPLPFRETLELYSEELKNISNVIIKKMGIALNMDEKEMKELFEVDGLQTMRINYYPPCPEPEKVIGVTPHSDGGGLTILLQVSEVEGLQIKKDGIWVPVKPLPNAFIINIGDILEIVTNGIYKSIEHRAVVNSEKERLSLGTFRSPRLDSILGPASSLITKETPSRFKTIKMKEYVERLFARKLGVKSYIDVLRI